MRASTKVRPRAVRVVWALLFVMALSTTLFGQANQALIVHDGTGMGTSIIGTLQPKLEAAAYTVTTNVGVPAGSLSGYKQIWDVRYDNTTPVSAGDQTAYTTYLSGGGSLFLMGENTGFATRNNSIAALVSALGGGTITIMAPNYTQTVQSPFTGPNTVSSVAFLACGGVPSPYGTGSAVTKDGSDNAGSVVWGPGSMTNATAGTLIIVLDVNFLLPGSTTALQDFTRNLIAYMAAPTPITPAATPVPPSLLLVLAGGAAAAAVEIRRRMVS